MFPSMKIVSLNGIHKSLGVCSLQYGNFVKNVVGKVQQRHFADKGRRGRRKFVEPVVVKQTMSAKRAVDVYADMSTKELSDALKVDFDTIADALINLDKKNLNLIADEQPLGQENIIKASATFNFKPRVVIRPVKRIIEESDDLFPQAPPEPSDCKQRPPIVTIMGHVDHGKTTLLDALRNSQITCEEFGGITQHIGAFSVDLKGTGRCVTFLDTPGHAAFGAMRERGAFEADIVVLVVAADDGVKEQTVQSIKFAQSAGVPLVLAINKCDKPTANPERAKRSLLEHGVVVEDLGGDVQCVEISALLSKNLPALQDALLMQADMMDLKTTWAGLVEGVIIESSVSHGIGKLCTIIVSRGLLKKNAILVAGTSWCRVRTITDENGKPIDVAGPSVPVRVSGWKEDLPSPGDYILETNTVDKAQKAVRYRAHKELKDKTIRDWKAIEEKRTMERSNYLVNRQKLLDKGFRYGSTIRRVVHKESRLEKHVEGFPKLNILFRADVEGTLEAIMEIIDSYTSDQCKLQVVDFGVGPPTQKDIDIAKETDAIIYMFNVQPSLNIRTMAEASGVRVEYYNIIYRLVESLKKELSSRLPSNLELELVAEGHVIKEFLISDRGRKRQPIAGVLIGWGNFNRDSIYKFIRGSTIIYEGVIESMKQGMEVVANAKTNTEVGIALDNKDIRFKEDDRVEVYIRKEIPQFINWSPPGF